MIEALHEAKRYKVETLYLATSLSDRYLKQLLADGSPKPCLLTLPVACLIMAAKL